MAPRYAAWMISDMGQRDLNQLANLSPSERRLNRWLLGLACAGAVYALLEHVVLINTPELFRGGAQLGDFFYDLAIGYLAAYIFYLLVIRAPLMQTVETSTHT